MSGSTTLAVLVSSVFNICAAVFAGVQFASLFTILTGTQGQADRAPLHFSFGLLAFAVPFYAPITEKLPQTVSAFIALVAVTTLIRSRTNQRDRT